ncbi:MAG TPA: amidase family protein [Frankiaceae bacterium]|jgi:amidase|nr:amidase family protein [Frankiaceae bacterium]
MRPATFRLRLLACAAALTLTPLVADAHSTPPRPACTSTAGGVDLQRGTILDLQRAMAARRLTSEQLVTAYVSRIATWDASAELNSIRALNPNAVREARALDAERRRGRVRGPLHGIPVLLKDNVGTRGLATTAGSIALADNVPAEDATIVARLRAAGAVVLGKTNLSEFANWVDLSMPNGYSSLGGQVVNAYNGGDPSGSSSGSGVAGSMAFAAATIGTETSGSILSPSDVNGLVGVKPTLGLTSRYGIVPLAPSFDVPGPMVRTVTDAAAMLTAIAGPDPKDAATAEAQVPKGGYLPLLRKDALKGVRLGVPSADNRPGGERGEVFERAIADLKKAGATVVETDHLGTTALASLSELGLIPNEFKWSLNAYLATANRRVTTRTLSAIVEYNKAHPDKVKYGQRLLEASDATPGLEALATASALPVRTQAQAAIDSALAADDLDAVLELGPGNANVGAAAGYPTVIVPAGVTGDGTAPVGLAFTGTAYAEPRLLAYAYAYEQVSHRRVPPTYVNADLRRGSCR